MNREIAEKAAKWWRNRLEGTPHFDNGEYDPANSMAMVMAIMIANEHRPTKESLDKFEKILTEKILTDMMEYNGSFIGMHCEYGPDRMLFDAAKESGVPCERFPFKTSMNVYPDYVEVQDGYGADWVKL